MVTPPGGYVLDRGHVIWIAFNPILCVGREQPWPI